MNHLVFWKNWQKSTQFVFVFSIALLLLCSLLLGYYYVNFLQNVIHWDVLSELQETSVSVEQFKTAQETLNIPSKSFLISEQFLASTMAINYAASWIYTILGIIALALINTGISFIGRVWYLVFMGFNVLLLVSLQWDLPLLQPGHSVGLCVVIGFIGISYYFHAFQRNTSVLIRFLSFVAYLSFAELLVASLSNQASTITHFASHQVLSGLCLTTLFVFWIAYEIPNGFLIIATSTKSPQSLLNFSILTFTYLVNVLLVFLYNNKSIDWDMLYISPFLLLVIATLLGIWGIKQRMILIEKVLGQSFSASLVYIGLAIFSLATSLFAFATANDPMIEVIEDAITYSHLVMGTLFFLYVIANFYPLFQQQFEVYKVVFKPISLPIYVFRIVALIIIVALLSIKSFYPINQCVTAYYNTLGDNSVANKEYIFAEIQYKKALSAEFRNHKTNYALASLALHQNDNETAALYFKRALAKSPSPFAYEGLARSFSDRDRFFDAIFTLKEGIKRFPTSGELQNNLAYLYTKAQLPDSSIVALENALPNSSRPEIIASNILAFWAKNGKLASQKEVLQKAQDYHYDSFQANLLTLKLATEQSSQAAEAISKLDSNLNVSTFALLFNMALFQKEKGTSIAFRQLAKRTENDQFSEDLEFAHAIQQYYKADKQLTFEQLQAWAHSDTTTQKNRYYQVLLNTLIQKESYANAPNQTITTDKAAQQLVYQYPLDVALLEKITLYYNKQKHPEKAYQALNNALKWRKNNARLWELYILQSLAIGMKSYANDALQTLQKSFPTDYQRFLPEYQVKVSLIEKQSDGFQ